MLTDTAEAVSIRLTESRAKGPGSGSSNGSSYKAFTSCLQEANPAARFARWVSAEYVGSKKERADRHFRSRLGQFTITMVGVDRNHRGAGVFQRRPAAVPQLKCSFWPVDLRGDAGNRQL